MKNKNSLLLIFLLFISVFGIGRLLDNGRMMIPEFTVPYFSGAALLHQGQGWKFNLNEVDSLHAFQAIPDKKESVVKINAYRFASEEDNTRAYSINQPGYLYVSLLAGNIFWWTGDIGAVKLLQLLFHTIVCLLILFQLKSKRHKQIINFPRNYRVQLQREQTSFWHRCFQNLLMNKYYKKMGGTTTKVMLYLFLHITITSKTLKEGFDLDGAQRRLRYCSVYK